MKKLTVLLVLAALCMGLVLPAAAAEPVFSDVPAGHWAQTAIEDMAARGIVQGVGGERFDPDSPVTSAEFCAMLTRLFYPDELSAQQAGTGTAWWLPAAEAARQAGLLEGTAALSSYTNGTWDSSVMLSPMSRYDMAQAMTNTLTAQGIALPSDAELEAARAAIADFDTVPASYTHAVTAMYALGCLQGTDGAGTFGGSENMDRAAACTVLARLLATVDGSASQPEPEPDPQDELDALRQEMLERVNEERAKVGAPALVLDETLCEAAQLRAQETAENYSHTRPDGSSCFTVLDEFGITRHGAAENIYASPETVDAAMDGWMDSPGHRTNILNSDLRAIGIGYYYTDEGWNHYWVQLFIG